MSAYELANLAAALLVSGPIASALTQAVKRSGWRRSTRLLLAVGISLAVGVAQAWISGSIPAAGGGLTAESALAASLVVFTGASAFYRLYFRRRAGRVHPSTTTSGLPPRKARRR
jgi:predicted exporter